ncbi:MAG TPA: TonB-dependent receptor [Bacteroidia bacterium]|nr:TonB-dependent receptor [Bacteroidia bacterium]
MRTSKIFLFIALLFAGSSAFAQNVLTGKIKDTLDGTGLPGAIIYIADLKQAAQTDANGMFTMNNLPKGTYLVEVQMLGYTDRAQNVKIEGTTTFNIALSETDVEEHEVVVTGTSKATSLQHTPQAITEVNKDYLNENSSTNVIDAIAQTPGVSAMTDGQSIAKPVIRGLGYNRVLTINDGVEQVDQPWFDEFGIEADPDAVNRYEILKGPGSLAYGSDAISGVINLIPEQPLPNGKTEGDVLFNYQTNNGLVNNMFHMAGTSNNGISWSARVDNTMAHAYDNPNDGYVLNSQFSNFNADGTIGIHRKWGYTQLHASYFSLHTGIVDGTRDSASGKMVQAFSYPDLNGGAPTYELPTQQELVSYTPLVIYQHIQHYKLVWDNSIAVGDGHISAIFSYQKNQRQETNDPTMPNTPDIYYYSDAVTFDARYSSPQIRGFNYAIGTNGVYQASQSLGTLMLIPNYNYLTIGGFAIANEKVSDKFYLSGGVRYDTRTFNGIDHWIDSTTQEPAQPNAPNSFHEFQGFKSTFSGMSWSFGATYDITKAIYVKANIAQGWRAPNVAECGANGVHDGTVVYEIGDPTLKPETNIEEDFTFGINSKTVTFEANVFNNSISDYIYAKGLLSVLGGDSINNSLNAVGLGAAPVYKYAQTGATLNGGEVSMDIHPEVIPWIDLDLSYSMVNGQLNGISDSTKYLPFVPPNRFIAELKFHIKKIGKSIDDAYIKFGLANYSEQSKVYEQYAIYSGLNTASTPFEYAASISATKGYTLFNLGFGGNIMASGHKFCELYIVCNNLTNLAYMDYMSRFKYLPVNYTTDRVGVFNMGRNVSVKLIIPFSFNRNSAAAAEKD